jgi:hypothetical protein
MWKIPPILLPSSGLAELALFYVITKTQQPGIVYFLKIGI